MSKLFCEYCVIATRLKFLILYAKDKDVTKRSLSLVYTQLSSIGLCLFIRCLVYPGDRSFDNALELLITAALGVLQLVNGR